MSDSREQSDSIDFTEWLLKRVLIGVVLLLGVVLAIIWAVKQFGPSQSSTPSPAATTTNPSSKHTATLIIDHGSNVRLTYPALTIPDNATVLDLVKAAGASPSRPLVIESKGSGEMTLITSIDGVRNDSGGTGHYWQFTLNGVYAKTGVGSGKVQPGDTVTFIFGPDMSSASPEPAPSQAAPPASPPAPKPQP
jgi:hypothetical protein